MLRWDHHRVPVCWVAYNLPFLGHSRIKRLSVRYSDGTCAPCSNRHQFWYSTTNQTAPILILNHKLNGTNYDTQPQIKRHQFWYSTTHQTAPILILNHTSNGTNSDTQSHIKRHQFWYSTTHQTTPILILNHSVKLLFIFLHSCSSNSTLASPPGNELSVCSVGCHLSSNSTLASPPGNELSVCSVGCHLSSNTTLASPPGNELSVCSVGCHLSSNTTLASPPGNELSVCSVGYHLSSRSLNPGTDSEHSRKMYLMERKTVAAWPVSDTHHHEHIAILLRQYACCTG